MKLFMKEKKQSKDYNSESSTLITLGFFVLVLFEIFKTFQQMSI
jgi:hypothetical protein